MSLSWSSLPWYLLFVHCDAFLHSWAPSVWFWLTCVINPVQDDLLASASWIQNVFAVTFFVSSFYCQSVRLFMVDFLQKSSWRRFATCCQWGWLDYQREGFLVTPWPLLLPLPVCWSGGNPPVWICGVWQRRATWPPLPWQALSC